MKYIKHLIILVGVVSLFSCASNSFVAQNFNPHANKHIKTINVVASAPLEEVPVTVRNHAGMSFGLIGAIVASVDISDRTTTYNNALSPLKIEWQTELQSALQQQLETAGYQVNTTEHNPSLLQKEGKHKLTPELFSSSDAVLFTNYSLRYMSAGMADAYQPYVVVSATLYDSIENIVYTQAFHYGFPEKSAEFLHITADTHYSFQKLSQLVDNIDSSVEGLKTGLVKIAEYIGQDLTPPSQTMSAPIAQTGSE